MAPGLIKPAHKKWIKAGTGRSDKFYFYKGRRCNLHGTLVVGAEVYAIALQKSLKQWYKNHQLYIWYWLVFFTWAALGCMFGLMVYAVMP